MPVTFVPAAKGAFSVFLAEGRHLYRKPNVVNKPGELMRIASIKWQAMLNEDKQQYVQKSDQLKKKRAIKSSKLYETISATHIQEMNRMLRLNNYLNTGKSRRARLPEPGQPARPPSSYVLYLKELRTRTGTQSSINFNAQSVKSWRALSEEERNKYYVKTMQLMRQYVIDARAFRERRTRERIEEMLRQEEEALE
ncbi:hypothetical protein BDF19DRAFT_175119 [Syncephalis fuscata]|nr:hypothetical protein BDF19DRAFT_175119 [Syncephalis fuscata]